MKRQVPVESASALIDERIKELGDWRGMTLARVREGAALQDPSGLFKSSLDGNVRRAIDIHESDNVDEAALKDLIRSAVALNLVGKSKQKPRRARSKRAD